MPVQVTPVFDPHLQVQIRFRWATGHSDVPPARWPQPHCALDAGVAEHARRSGNAPSNAIALKQPSVCPETFRRLSDDWYASSSFARLAPRTKRDYVAAKKKIDDQWGSYALRDLDRAEVRPKLLAWRDRMGESSPRQADAIFAVLRLILEWGRDRGALAANHATRPKKLYRANRSDKIWRSHHLAKFRAVASPEIRLALELALWTGQRQTDLLKLRWANYDGRRIEFRQSKRGRKIDMPVAGPLRRLLDGTARIADTILTAPNGKPWRTEPRPTHFQHLWRRSTLEAGLDGLHFHDLRGTTCTVLAEAGATPSEIAAMLGWTVASVNRMLDTYQAMTASLSDSAVAKLETSPRFR